MNKKERIYDITIYYTNDLHGRLSTHDDNENSIGLEKISKVVNLSKVFNKNTFWFDAGDFTHGTPRMTNADFKELVKMLNATPLSAICTGNHDYNLAMNHLYKLAKQLRAYILSANTLEETNQHALLPYIIFPIDIKNDDYLENTGNSNSSKEDNIKLGVFAISTPETAYKTNPNNIKGINFADPINTAKYMTKLLRKNCDIVIAISHLGLDNSSEYTSKRLAEEVTGIDLIVDGHSHTVLPEGLKVNNTLIVQAGSHGKYLGKANICIHEDTKRIIDISTELFDQQKIDNIIQYPDTYIANVMQQIDDNVDKTMNRIVAHSNQELLGNRELVRCKEAPLGRLSADAMRWMTKSDIAIVNGGTLRTSLPKGDITYKDLISVFPFENKVYLAKIDGKTIKEMLEHSVFAVPAAFGGFLHVSGMTFSFNTDSTPRVQEIYIDSKPINDEQIYTLATLDFLFAGGDDYKMLIDLPIIEQYGNVENVISEYLNEVGIQEDIFKDRITLKE